MAASKGIPQKMYGFHKGSWPFLIISPIKMRMPKILRPAVARREHDLAHYRRIEKEEWQQGQSDGGHNTRPEPEGIFS